MQIDRVIFPIKSLGPGERLIIWTVGCSARCPCCSNPELWRRDPNKDVNVHELVDLIRQATERQKLDGITITGGEPLEQAGELIVLLPLLSEVTDDILLYTGHRYEDIENSLSKTEHCTFRKYISVVIDGKYIDNLNDSACTLRGSTNQRIHLLDESKGDKYMEYIAMGRTVQNVFCSGEMVSVGIHNKD